jgi:chromosome segregation ATPase
MKKQSLANQIMELGAKKVALELEHNHALSKIEVKKKELEGISSSITEAHARLSELKVKIDDKKDELLKLNAKLLIEKAKRTNKLSELDLGVADVAIKLNRLDHKTDEKSKRISSLEHEIASLEFNKDELISKINEKKRVEDMLVAVETRLASLVDDVNSAEARLSNIDAELRLRSAGVFEKEIALNKTIHDLRVVGRRVQEEYTRLGLGTLVLPIDVLDITIKEAPLRRSQLS